MTATWNLLQPAPATNESYNNALLNGSVSNVKATEFTFGDGSDKIIYRGNFTVDQFGFLTGGTVTGIQLFSGVTKMLEASGYAMSATALLQALAVVGTSYEPLGALFDAAPLIINGSPGLDFVGGTPWGDHFFGNQGNDTFYAFDGNDFVSGGPGQDELDGDEGSDTVDYSEKADDLVIELKGAVASEVTVAGIVEDTIFDFENVNAGSGNDRITGDAQVNRLVGNAGDDTIFGNAGNDLLFGGAGEDALDGGSGNDGLDGGSGADTMKGGAGGDTYVVDNVGDKALENANEGADTVEASVSFTLGAHVENLVLTGNAAINGTGNGQANIITGNGAANIVDGKGGADTMRGNGGDDTYIVDNAGDVVIEAAGGGNDTVISAVAYTLGAGIENLELVGSAGAVAKGETVDGIGNGLANLMTGSAGDNVLDGAAGNDRLNGGDGRDRLIGGLGDDALSGGRGKDMLDGGDGGDQFLFDSALGKVNADKIVDFRGEDQVLLDDLVFTGLKSGGLKKKAYFEGSAAHDKNDRIILDKKGKIYFDVDGKGGEDALLFAKVGKGVDLSHHDFLVV